MLRETIFLEVGYVTMLRLTIFLEVDYYTILRLTIFLEISLLCTWGILKPWLQNTLFEISLLDKPRLFKARVLMWGYAVTPRIRKLEFRSQDCEIGSQRDPRATEVRILKSGHASVTKNRL